MNKFKVYFGKVMILVFNFLLVQGILIKLEVKIEVFL